MRNASPQSICRTERKPAPENTGSVMSRSVTWRSLIYQYLLLAARVYIYIFRNHSLSTFLLFERNSGLQDLLRTMRKKSETSHQHTLECLKVMLFDRGVRQTWDGGNVYEVEQGWIALRQTVAGIAGKVWTFKAKILTLKAQKLTTCQMEPYLQNLHVTFFPHAIFSLPPPCSPSFVAPREEPMHFLPHRMTFLASPTFNCPLCPTHFSSVGAVSRICGACGSPVVSELYSSRTLSRVLRTIAVNAASTCKNT